jgi:hypothetical protein
VSVGTVAVAVRVVSPAMVALNPQESPCSRMRVGWVGRDRVVVERSRCRLFQVS